MPPVIFEQDGNIVLIVADGIEVIAQMTRSGDEIIFDRLSIDGPGHGAAGLRKLKAMAREFAKAQGVTRLRIRGTKRETGANPGKLPREVVITV